MLTLKSNVHIITLFLLALVNKSIVLGMEKNYKNEGIHLEVAKLDVAKLDKESKQIITNILAMTDTFLNNSKHMLRYLKKIAKHAPSAIVPNAEERAYLNIPFELPGNKPCFFKFKDVALKYKLSNDDASDELYYIKNNDEKANVHNERRLENLLYDKCNDFNHKKVFNSGKFTVKVLLAYQFFGRSTRGFFIDPHDIKIFNQQCLNPSTLLYFLENKQKIKNGNKPTKKAFDTTIDQDIYCYMSLLYAFEKLLDFETQIPLYNLVVCDSYLNGNGINTKKYAELLKTHYIKEHYFQQFIPLLAQEHPIVNDYTCANATKLSNNEAKISDKKIKKTLQLLKEHVEAIAFFDSIHNALFHLCFTMYKTRSVPVNLTDIICSVENKLECSAKYTNPLYALYENVYSTNNLKHCGFWGLRLLQKNIYLPEKIFSEHISSELKEQIKLAQQKKEAIRFQQEALAAQAANELLAGYEEDQDELVVDRKQKKQKNNTRNNKLVMRENKNNQKNKKNSQSTVFPTTNTKQNITNKSSETVQKKSAAKKTVQKVSKNSEVAEIDSITISMQPEIVIEKNDSISEPCLLFDKRYFEERLTNEALYDHYHGIPGNMIYNIIHTGTAMPLPTDRSGKAKVFFGVAATKTVLGRYLYQVPIVITDQNGCIFHIGLHKENNATERIGNIASKKIAKLKSVMEWPSLEIDANIKNNKTTITSHSYNRVPENGVSVSLKDFNSQFPCTEILTNYANTKTYCLPNKESLIFLNAHTES